MTEADAEIREGLTYIEGNLSQLKGFVAEFATALGVFDSASAYDDAVQRMFMSAKSGAVIVFNIGKILQFTGSQMRPFKELDALIDHESLRRTRREFEQTFPHFLGSRHAVAHAGEVSSTPKEFNKHAVKTGEYATRGSYASGDAIMVTGNLEGRTLHSTWGGRAVSYEMSRASLQAPTSVSDAFCEALSKLPQSHEYGRTSR